MVKNNKNQVLTRFLVVLLLLITGVALAKAPSAGTVIKNQASATYRDSAGIIQTATSNLVETVIQQVGAFLLSESQSRYGIAGQEVNFPHVLTNIGNGDDSFTLGTDNLSGDAFDFSSIAIYPDENQDGVADSLTPLTDTGTLAAGEAFYFVVKATIPSGLADTEIGSLEVTATSEFMSNAVVSGSTKTNEDDVVITDKAVIQVTKSMSAESGTAGSTEITVTLTYSNPSTTTASNVRLVDVLPAGMTYVENSGEWSVTGSGTVLTDENQESQGGAETIIYCAYPTGCTTGENEVSAVIASVVPGDSGTISFNVLLTENQAASTLLNTAQFSYNNSAVDIAEQNTNQVPVLVVSQPAVAANNSTSDSDQDAGGDVVVSSAGLGSTVSFDNVIWNNGNNTDTFDISIDTAGSTFPTGTTFMLYHSDGFTPLLDTDNSSVVDTGPLDSGDYYTVVLKATLPMNATVGNNSNNGFKVVKTAASALDSSVSDSVTDSLTEIVGSRVDLTNVAALLGDGVKGVGAGPESEAQSQLILAPGESGAFRLYVNNTSNVADSFDLTFSSTGSPFAPGTAPSGWRVAFHEDAGATNCSTLGPVVSNTAVIAANSSKLICANITLPSDADFTGTAVSIYFRALSPLTQAVDIKHDAVYMTAAQQLILEPDNRAQVEPGSSVVYTHQIHNPGNTVFTSIILDSTDTLGVNGWTTVLFKDSDGDGVLTGADERLSAGTNLLTGVETLDPGESKTIFAKVFAPANTSYGLTNLTDIIAVGTTDAGNSIEITVKAQDMTFVSKSNMSITKEQGPDADCDGEVDTGKSYGFDSFQAQPGTCVLYRLTATNTSTGIANNVRIDDAIPNFTSHFTDAGTLPSITTPGSIVKKPDEGGSGLIEGSVASVNPGKSVSLVFGVKVD